MERSLIRSLRYASNLISCRLQARRAWSAGGEARRWDETILVGSCPVGDCAPSHPILMSNLALPIFLPAGLLLLASNRRTEEPKPPPSTPVGSQDGNLHGPGALIFSPKYSSKPRSWETHCYLQAGRVIMALRWPMAEIRRAAALPTSHFQFLSCKHTPGVVSSKALCELKAVLAARLILHGDKKNEPGEVFPAPFSHLQPRSWSRKRNRLKDFPAQASRGPALAPPPASRRLARFF